MNPPLDHGLQYTGIHPTSDLSVLSALPDSYCPPTVAEYSVQQSRNLGNGPMETSSRSLLKPVKAPSSADPCTCHICGQQLSQSQGVPRHIRDVHEPSMCPSPYCGFEWSRPPKLKEHLMERHPDIPLRPTLANVTRYRRRVTWTKNHPQGQHALPLPTEYDRRSWGERLQQPLTLPLPPSPALEVTHVSSPATASCLVYYPPPEHTTSNYERGM
jgi:hypothetical protein